VCSGSQEKGEPECTCSFRSRGNPFHGQGEVIERSVLLAGRILDRATDQTYVGCEPDRFRRDFRRVTKASFEIRRDGQIVAPTI
jgi:hypothetical protein